VREFDSVVLARDLPDLGLAKGDVGTVVLIHPGGGCEVEFTTLTGEPLAVASLADDAIRPVDRREIAHARPMEAPGTDA
jgi:hypothetical protein